MGDTAGRGQTTLPDLQIPQPCLLPASPYLRVSLSPRPRVSLLVIIIRQKNHCFVDCPGHAIPANSPFW